MAEVDLDRVRSLVRQLSEALGLDVQPEKVRIVDVEYEESDDPSRPGSWETVILSTGERRRNFLPRAGRGIEYGGSAEGEAER